MRKEPDSVIDHDKQGRKYVNIKDLKPGDTVLVDGDFGCLVPWSMHVIHKNAGGFYINCSRGQHNVDVQDDGHGNLMGIYPEGTKGK